MVMSRGSLVFGKNQTDLDFGTLDIVCVVNRRDSGACHVDNSHPDSPLTQRLLSPAGAAPSLSLLPGLVARATFEVLEYLTDVFVLISTTSGAGTAVK
jgi:hypothetical protein